MHIYKNLLKHLKNPKSKFMFYACSIVILGLFLYAIISVEMNKNSKLNKIEDLPKNLAVIDTSVYPNFPENETSKYKSIEYTTRNLISVSQNVVVDIITPGLLEIGLPVYHDPGSSIYNIEPIEILHIETELDFSEIDNPIIIDEITSLTKFQRLDSVGEQMIVYIENVPVNFQVYAVIKETRERLDLIEFVSHNGLPDEVNLNAVGYSHAYIFEETYIELVGTKPQYQLMIVDNEVEFQTDEIGSLLNVLDVDVSNYPYINGISINQLFRKLIEIEYMNSMVTNIVVVSAISVVLILTTVVISKKMSTKTDF